MEDKSIIFRYNLEVRRNFLIKFEFNSILKLKVINFFIKTNNISFWTLTYPYSPNTYLLVLFS
jgi:hypothetical protein